MMDPRSLLAVASTIAAGGFINTLALADHLENNRRRHNFKRLYIWRKHPKNAQARYVSACTSVAKRAHRFRRNLF